MPRKKKEMPIQTSDSFTAGKPEPIAPTPVPVETPVVETPVQCGHICRHTNPGLTCVLPTGHAGNHTDGQSAWKDEAGYVIG